MNRYFTIILNPTADQGNAKKKIPLIKEFFSKNAADFKIVLTEGIGHATSIAESSAQILDNVIVAAAIKIVYSLVSCPLVVGMTLPLEQEFHTIL